MASECPNFQVAGGICRVVKKEAENLATGVTRGACDCNFICHAHHGSKLCKTPQTIHGNSLGILMWEIRMHHGKAHAQKRPPFYLPKVVETRSFCQRCVIT